MNFDRESIFETSNNIPKTSPDSSDSNDKQVFGDQKNAASSYKVSGYRISTLSKKSIITLLASSFLLRLLENRHIVLNDQANLRFGGLIARFLLFRSILSVTCSYTQVFNLW